MRRALTATWAAALLAVATGLPAAARAAPQAESFVPANWPDNNAPVDWPGNPGTRLTMPDFAKKYPAERRAWKVKVTGAWTKQQWQSAQMGTYRVGDRVEFGAMVGDRDSKFFASVKDRRDGGKFQATVYWMDPAGRKVLKEDPQAVRLSCATCGGYWWLYFNVPSYGPSGRHRLRLSYVHDRLKMNVQKEMIFRVENDGSWDDTSVVDEAAKGHQAVAILQPGRPSRVLGAKAYAGLADTYMHATHNVPDRNADFANYGTLPMLRAGHYGQEQRALVRFDLSAVPAGAKVGAAWLQLYLADWSGGDRGRRGARAQFVAYEVLKDWKAGRGNGNYFWHDKKNPPIAAGEASWQHFAHPAKWAKAGCGQPGVDRGAAPAGKSEVVRKYNRWVTIPLEKSVVARWLARPGANRGLLIVGTQACAMFHSGEFEDAAMRPRLILAFSAGLGQPGTCTKDACSTFRLGRK